eukprot:550095_1
MAQQDEKQEVIDEENDEQDVDEEIADETYWIYTYYNDKIIKSQVANLKYTLRRFYSLDNGIPAIIFTKGAVLGAGGPTDVKTYQLCYEAMKDGLIFMHPSKKDKYFVCWSQNAKFFVSRYDKETDADDKYNELSNKYSKAIILNAKVFNEKVSNPGDDELYSNAAIGYLWSNDL